MERLYAQKIGVSAHDHIGKPIDRKFEKLVIFRIATSGYRLANLDALGFGKQSLQAFQETLGDKRRYVRTLKQPERFFLRRDALDKAAVVFQPAYDEERRRLRFDRRADENVRIYDKADQDFRQTSSRA